MTDYISTRYSIFEAEDCKASGMRLRAVAQSCQTSDNLVWKYIVENPINNEVLQYSYNYSPTPSNGKQGDNTLDKLNQTFEANIVILDELSVGDYKITWSLTVNNDFTIFKDQYFSIVDNVAPILNLHSLLTKTSGSIIEAKEFDKGDCDNCYSSNDNCSIELFFTFSSVLPKFEENVQKWEKQFAKYGHYYFDPKTGLISTENRFLQNEADMWIPEKNTSARYISCNISKQMKNNKLEVFVWDEFLENDDDNYNNYSSQEVILNLPTLDCRYFIIEGYIIGAKSNLPMNNMTLSLYNSESQFTTTDTNGFYIFNDIEYDTPFQLIATNDSVWLNGITTLDIVLIQKHLLGIKKLNDPFKLIAADVNFDEKITASDILSLRKLILGSATKLPKHSWIGFPNDYTITDPSNILHNLNDIINRERVLNDNLNLDFKAIKIGDINNSADMTYNRGDDKVKLVIENTKVDNGKYISIPIYAKNFNNILGGQFSMGLNGVSNVNISSGVLSINKSNFNFINNSILFSWNSTNTISVEDGEVLFTLNITANKTDKLSNLLSIDDNILRTEFYKGGSNEIVSGQFVFRSDNNQFELFQNEPNPFDQSTMISFNLNKNDKYSISIYNMRGQLITEINGLGKKGFNSITIDSQSLYSKNLNTRVHSPNIYLYKLISGENIAIRKMVISNP